MAKVEWAEAEGIKQQEAKKFAFTSRGACQSHFHYLPIILHL